MCKITFIYQINNDLSEISNDLSDIGNFSSDCELDTVYTAQHNTLVIVGFLSQADNSAVGVQINTGQTSSRLYEHSASYSNRTHQVIGYASKGETFKVLKLYSTSSVINYIHTVQI